MPRTLVTVGGAADSLSGAIAFLGAWGEDLENTRVGAVLDGLDPAAREICVRSGGTPLAAEELVGFLRAVLAGVLIEVENGPAIEGRVDPEMLAWLEAALAADFAAVSDEFELLVCDERRLAVIEGDLGRSLVVLLSRRGDAWSVAIWPSREDRVYVPPNTPGDLGGVREPRKPLVPSGHDHVEADGSP